MIARHLPFSSSSPVLTRASMVRWLGHLHRWVGLVLFAAVLATTGIVGYVAGQYGGLPSLEHPSGPDWAGLNLAAFLLFFLWMYTLYAWSALTALLLLVARSELRRNAVSIILCLLGIGAYLSMMMSPVLEWILD